ncbi:hypothetical protein FDH38_gp012 [Dinoroseobacter phage vB_DshS-R5C]|uniref:Uncharacterized protein n=1 Tax=Dinoroseobacter phage vB_DshS-R5C TaxID=1965368 RepID=A0A1V0DY30_9CAUD|nr:hypothetical protein FDH38_gp012 [Dinoroseobacter phage vB_DshS-R5C]ARB06066.1 hypothetical protein vBDshSR5C_12 [Dinoroseobacter phage vB_DshS-R5C]
MADALNRQVANGHGEFEVVVQMGNGDTKPVNGYEVATSAAYVAGEAPKERQQVRLITKVLF